ncbi:type VII secretion protein EccE [Tsukamurella ocularis]|uniref:type VII secretion protein EccE n=1 Tax=Tsukamurella ocularis TaxID=1970234 RepID=UPI00216768CF|nr:type VII secretion protein EccE [Tsukamurella ocularis]MCS3781484.1 type VII secretion protein EccE [Tsukamurella ocularis]MCS3787856.1 type VII secretion protein EccE [Tsukamurella ocularis]MCS3851150.1 type VII secretion protein EccE [Tsukamurella ocularis]
MTETVTPGPAVAELPTHPAVARLRRPVGIRISLRRALVWAVLSASLFALVGGAWPLWSVIVLIVLGALVAFVSVHGTVLSEKIGARARYLRRRRRATGGIPGRVIDVDGVGVRQGDGFELVSAIELTADAAETRLREGRAFAAETVPLDLLATMMTQYGLDVDIDVASVGRRVPPGPAYRASYSQGVRFYAAMAERSTWLVLRVNTRRNLAGIVRRGPSRTAGPKALMAATRRLEQRLQERLIRARVLPAAELARLDSRMTFGADLVGGTETWQNIEHGAEFATTYLIDPVRTSTQKLDRWWGLDSDSTSVVLRMRRADAQAPVEISGLVRYDTAVPIVDNLDDALVPMPGRQMELARGTLPGGGSSVVDLPSAPLDGLGAVEIPVGPAGPVWGVSGTDAVALPLFDGSPVPETLVVEFATELIPLQLVLLRSVGAGASVAVHTDRPAQWATLAATLADQARFRIADGPGGRPADITVFDGAPADAVPERTMLTLRAPGSAPERANADLVVEQVSPSAVRVRIGRRAPFDVVLNPTDEELRYCDVQAQPIAAVAPQQPAQRLPRQVPAPPRLAPGAATLPPSAAAQALPPPRVPAPPAGRHAQPPVPPRGTGSPYPVPAAHAPGAPAPGAHGAPQQPVPSHQAPPPVPPQRPTRPVRPLPPPPYERGTGAQRKQGGDRWVRPSQGQDDRTPRRRPVQPPSAPRWGKTGEREPSDEPPTSR